MKFSRSVGTPLVVLALAALATASHAHRARTGRRTTARAELGDTVRIPAGRFRMGSSAVEIERALEACEREVGPRYAELACERQFLEDEHAEQRIVALPAFELDRFETTVSEYRVCVSRGACTLDPLLQRGSPSDAPRPDDVPIVGVTFPEAEAYCRFRGKRLPTEAEWEYAARGIDGRAYPWGNTADARALAARMNHGTVAAESLLGRQPVPLRFPDDRDGERYESPVGAYPRGQSPFGVHDMAGNVAEWTSDWYRETGYDAEDTIAPTGPQLGSYKVARGGSYLGPPFRNRTTAREAVPPRDRHPWIGVRCARTVRR